MFHLLTLPFRIVFGVFFGLLALPFALLALPFALLALPLALLFAVLWLPVLFLRFVIKAAIGLLVLPIVLLVGAIVVGALLFGAAMAVIVPLSPLLLIAFVIWAVTRNSPAASAVRG